MHEDWNEVIRFHQEVTKASWFIGKYTLLQVSIIVLIVCAVWWCHNHIIAPMHNTSIVEIN